VGYTKYKKAAVESASREKLLLLLYEGAIKFTKKAILAAEGGDIPARCENISKAYDIILELMHTLDFKIGGDIAKNLEQLYIFMTDELTRANITGKVQHLNNVLKILQTLYDGWNEAIEIIKKNEAKGA
jgi:flagellar protein FliS